MKKGIYAFTAMGMLASMHARGQSFTMDQVQYWVGSGPDSSVLVMDFQDGSDRPSHAWGYLHDGNATGQDMVTAVADADPNLSVDLVGGFLNSATYNEHSGIGGSPNYWSTWSGTGMDDLAMNSGLAESLSNGSWLGCSYTDFSPALVPTTPVAAPDPFAFTLDDIQFWAGTGAHRVMLVVDFQEAGGHSSYAWGYRFDGSTTGEAVLNAVADADPAFAAVITSGFLSDLTWDGHSGIGGSPNWWSTWDATNLGNWTSNLGLSTQLEDGDLFGCSYTDFAPALPPNSPVAAPGSTAVAERTAPSLSVWPQPAPDYLNFRMPAGTDRTVELRSLGGALVRHASVPDAQARLDVRGLPAGLYLLRAGAAQRMVAVQ
jgi:hypothetical protein